MRSWSKLIISEIKTFFKLAQFVGKDVFGNKYYESSSKLFKNNKNSKKRWVVYKGYAEGSKASPEWHAWLHHSSKRKPASLNKKNVLFKPNMTGTPKKYSPAHPEKRDKNHYQSWRP
jgi:NADH:ubiquinone oxidoreductase subunit